MGIQNKGEPEMANFNPSCNVGYRVGPGPCGPPGPNVPRDVQPLPPKPGRDWPNQFPGQENYPNSGLEEFGIPTWNLKPPGGFTATA